MRERDREMFLKRLELIGFKSFADRIGIDFVPGVTAVVGPNGSGKSNISDAIRWVLGEQSAKSLRGAKMEDVIFSGSDSRKPLNFAEVTLILDNSLGLFPLDYTEISVSRRVFRSGESVYLLNGQQCRLKDINDVFIDSGLGKEAFSIISQGRVDEILNSRPEDRRSIFDEAAGVLKYRTRKKKAEHKLFETGDNLDRVLDILKELDSRIGPLEQRAKAAKEHAVLTKEAETADIMLLNYDAQQLRRELQIKAEKVQQFEQEKSIVEAEANQLDQSIGEQKTKLAALDEVLEKLQQQLVHSSSEVEKWEGRRLLFVEKERHVGIQSDRIQEELLFERQEQQKLEEKYKEVCRKKVELEKAYTKVDDELKAVTKILRRSVKETEDEIEELKGEYIDGLNAEATMRNELKHIAERLHGEQSSTVKMTEQYQDLTARLATVQDEQQHVQAAYKELQEKAATVGARYEQVRKLSKDTDEQLREKQTMLQTAYNKQHEMQGRIRALESMEADFSGFNQGVKEVLQARENGTLHKINGAVAELITVEPRYVRAIETALGGAMQHIITATEQAARTAIQYLKAKNTGRATFLPLDVMRSRKLSHHILQTVRQHPEFIETADELVQIDPSYQIITENLLGNVVIAKTLEGASALAKLLNYRYRVVTLDGDVVNAGGSLTGGGSIRRTSVFSRKAELEKLHLQQQQFVQSVEQAERTISDMKMELAKYMQQVETERQQLESLQVKTATVVAHLRELTNTIDVVESEMTALEIGRQGSQVANEQLNSEQQKLQDAHEALLKKLKQLEQDVATLERFAADWRTEEKSLNEKLSKLRETAAILREQKSHIQVTLEDIQRAQHVSKSKIESLEEELIFVASNDVEEELTLDGIIATIETAQQEKKEAQEQIERERVLRISYATSVDEQEVHLKELRRKTELATAAHHTETVQFSRLEVAYETILENLVAQYGLYPDEHFNEEGLFEVDVTRQRLESLKEQLEKIGPINPDAIGEYEEVAERHTFLTEQRNDLLEAKNTLQNAMDEMDEEMTARFSSTFEAIQQRFRQVFTQMFGGGNADLLLTDPTNLLETGVEIVARPPGKKLQNLSLLSGGERALTAISLLFATIEVRPVPFCILDEVEAALDEANVLRYSNYLKKFSKDTQFIVITHRKGTMEGADVLYGITMQESGVSKLISVKISEYEEVVQ